MSCIACTDQLDAHLEKDPALTAAWRQLRRRRLHAREVLLHAGEKVNGAWRIESGLVRSYFLSGEGRERNHCFYAEGQWVGAGTPPTEVESPYTIEALEDTTIVELPYSELQDWEANSDKVRTLISGVLSRMFAQQTQRQAELLLLDAPERYQAFMKNRPDLLERIPLHHIASYLGITNVALSRIRRRLSLQ